MRYDLTEADKATLHAAHQRVHTAREEYRQASAARAEVITELNDRGVSYQRLADVLGVHRTALRETATRTRNPLRDKDIT